MTKQNHYEAFLSIVEQNKGVIYKVANSFCRDGEDRKDLVQEIILKLWKSFETHKEQFKHSTWIYRIALNTAISCYRKEKTRTRLNAPLSENLFNMADFGEDRQPAQMTIHLNRFIAELKELDRALMLLYLEEKSHKEMAAIMGITETNVATKIGRLKAMLKNKFSQIQS